MKTVFSRAYVRQNFAALIINCFIVPGVAGMLLYLFVGHTWLFDTTLFFVVAILLEYGRFKAISSAVGQPMTFVNFFNTELAGPITALVAINLVYVLFCAIGTFPWSLLYGFFIAPLGLFSYYYGRFLGINGGWNAFSELGK